MVQSEWDREGELEEGKLLRDALHPDCAVTASRAPFLLLSPLLTVTDDTATVRRIWETYSPQAKLPRPSPCSTSSPFLLLSNLYSVQQPSHSPLGSQSLDFTHHLAVAHFSLPPWLTVPLFAPCPSFPVFFFFFFCCEMQFDWEP